LRMRRSTDPYVGSPVLARRVHRGDLTLCDEVRVHVSAPEAIRCRLSGERRPPIDAKEDSVTDSASLTDPGPGFTGEDPDQASGQVDIDPEDIKVVPAALMGMVTSARATYRAMRANGCYPAIMAVGAVEDTVATLARVSSHLELYVGDYSGQGGKAVVRASDLLGQARSVLSDARHHLALDEMAQPDPTPQKMAALTG